MYSVFPALVHPCVVSLTRCPARTLGVRAVPRWNVDGPLADADLRHGDAVLGRADDGSVGPELRLVICGHAQVERRRLGVEVLQLRRAKRKLERPGPVGRRGRLAKAAVRRKEEADRGPGCEALAAEPRPARLPSSSRGRSSAMDDRRADDANSIGATRDTIAAQTTLDGAGIGIRALFRFGAERQDSKARRSSTPPACSRARVFATGWPALHFGWRSSPLSGRRSGYPSRARELPRDGLGPAVYLGWPSPRCAPTSRPAGRDAR